MTLGALASSVAAAQEARTLDAFDTPAAWTAVPADGVSLTLGSDAGVTGRALRLDVDFHGGGGYAVARRALPLDLPPNYAFTFWLRGTVPPNTLEFKLLDATGQNVWWTRRPDVRFTAGWTKVTIRKRQIAFAWGPLGGGELRRAASLEIAVTAGSGGKGSVWLDELALTALPPAAPDDRAPRATASSAAPGPPVDELRVATRAPVTPSATRAAPIAAAPAAWRSAADGEQWLALDFGAPREYGGLVVDWDAADRAVDYDVEASDDGAAWTTLRAVRGAGPGRRWHRLPDGESRWIRLHLRRSARGGGYAVRAIAVLPLTDGATPTALMQRIAAASPKGTWPRAMVGQQSYWTVVGVSGGGARAALLGEDGGVEPRPGAAALEPFVWADGRLLTWADGRVTHALDGGRRPIPTVTRSAPGVDLAVTTFATGTAAGSTLWVRYRVTNTLARRRPVRLAIALRPLQVNPPWQFLGTAGGAAEVRTLAWDGRRLTVNGEDTVVAVTRGASFGALAFDGGSIVDSLAVGRLPEAVRIADSTGLASGALAWDLALGARASVDVVLAVPTPGVEIGDSVGTPDWDLRLAEARAAWDSTLGQTTVRLPAPAGAIERTLATALAHILVNRDGPAIRPGTRSYARSWIRDGALTSTALLRSGHAAEVRAFLQWYAPFQYANGKVPCCVDRRGADPVPEHDSDGELIYLLAEYWRHTHDTATVRRLLPNVHRAVDHLDSLRRSRLTAVYRTPDSLHLAGLLAPSISHEGYSAKPAYSYWDDFWAMRGFDDAVVLGRALGDPRVPSWTTSRDDFRRDLAASIDRARAVHHVAFIPGAADLGDFDATSTTIALSPGNDLAWLPRDAVRATFDRYWSEFVARRDGTKAWDAYTPYEWRVVGSFVRLGLPERALALVDWLLKDRRPDEWNQWAEVVWRDARAPKFIGDMPHGWVASDFIRGTLDLLAYEREADSVLVVGAGVPRRWLASADAGVVVRGLGTWWGALDLDVRLVAPGRVRVTLGGGVRPPGGFVVHAPFGMLAHSATVDGRPADLVDGAVRIAHGAAVVEFVGR